MNLESLHAWLFDQCKSGGRANVIDMMSELAGLRRGPNPKSYDDLPFDGITMQEWLERLEREGKAVRDGSWWRWADGKPVVVKAKESQGSLFG